MTTDNCESNFDRQAGATNSVLFLGLCSTKANNTVSFYVSSHRGATHPGSCPSCRPRATARRTSTVVLGCRSWARVGGEAGPRAAPAGRRVSSGEMNAATRGRAGPTGSPPDRVEATPARAGRAAGWRIRRSGRAEIEATTISVPSAPAHRFASWAAPSCHRQPEFPPSWSGPSGPISSRSAGRRTACGRPPTTSGT
jgi:hypothetical protein